MVKGRYFGLTALLLCLFWGSRVDAQQFYAGRLDVSAGTSVLRNTGMHMPLDLRAQYGVNDFFKAGVYFSYGLKVEKDGWYDFFSGEPVNRYTHFLFPGACATVCLTCLEGVGSKLNLPEAWELYATAFAGARLGVRKVPADPLAPKWPLMRKFRPGLVLGGQYSMGTNLSLYVEAGYGPTGSLAGGVVYSLK